MMHWKEDIFHIIAKTSNKTEARGKFATAPAWPLPCPSWQLCRKCPPTRKRWPLRKSRGQKLRTLENGKPRPPRWRNLCGYLNI